MQVCPGFRARLWLPSLRRQSSLLAQDVVVQKDQQRREGEILGVADGKLRIKIGPAETSLPMDQVASVVEGAPRRHTMTL